jgi:hypothetical protein
LRNDMTLFGSAVAHLATGMWTMHAAMWTVCQTSGDGKPALQWRQPCRHVCRASFPSHAAVPPVRHTAQVHVNDWAGPTPIYIFSSDKSTRTLR